MNESTSPDQAKFDLERFIDMFDSALTSDDPRVVDALRSLMMMVILTKPETSVINRTAGPLRQLHNDIGNLSRRIDNLEDNVRREQSRTRSSAEFDRYRYQPAPYKWDDFSLKDQEFLKQAIFKETKSK